MKSSCFLLAGTLGVFFLLHFFVFIAQANFSPFKQHSVSQ